jgi:citrate lyase subunit beta/citryl-CoA lyase
MTLRSRRSCLAVPGSSTKMIGKAQELPADQVFLDLEDAVAQLAKEDARKNVVAALNEGDWGGKVRTVRVNDLTTRWTYRDVIEVVEGAGANLDCVMLPKVAHAWHVQWLDTMLSQIEATMGFERRIGIECQIENAMGLSNIREIAFASDRIETIIFGPADFMASINMPSLVVGGLNPDYPADPYHHILMEILIAARAAGVQAIDGPYLQIRDVDGFTEVARRSAALGFDGKWVLHPGQLDAANEVYAPKQDDYDHAELILDAYEHYTSEAGGRRGAVMLGDEMIDEASRKMALVIAGKGRAAGMTRDLEVRAAGGVARRQARVRRRASTVTEPAAAAAVARAKAAPTPLRSTAAPARTLPIELPTRKLVISQENASVTVPSGACSPTRTNSQEMAGAIITPDSVTSTTISASGGTAMSGAVHIAISPSRAASRTPASPPHVRAP